MDISVKYNNSKISKIKLSQGSTYEERKENDSDDKSYKYKITIAPTDEYETGDIVMKGDFPYTGFRFNIDEFKQFIELGQQLIKQAESNVNDMYRYRY